MRRVINVEKWADDSTMPLLVNLCGSDPYVTTYGFGKWYGNSIAFVVEPRNPKNSNIVVVWQRGYKMGADSVVERQISDYIDSL
jgi:hypothetical protein